MANAAAGALVAAVAEPSGDGHGIRVWLAREHDRAVREGRIRGPDHEAEGQVC